MHLKNEFPQKVRNMYFDIWRCSLCGMNGNNRGGLSLHHIKGRESSSALNACLLCGVCHACMNHNEEEEKELMIYQIQFLVRNNYCFSNNDLKFYAKYKKVYDSFKRKGNGYFGGNLRLPTDEEGC